MNVINFENHACKKIRDYLDSYLNNELLVETNHEVLKHLEGCEACSQALEARKKARELLQKAARKEAAPAALRERIRKEIRKDRSATVARPFWQYWAVAAAVAALALSAWGVFHLQTARRFERVSSSLNQTLSDQTAEIFKVGLRDHAHCAIDAGLANQRFTHEQMVEAMGQDYAGLISIAQEKIPGNYEIVVAHRCVVNKRRFAHLILRSERNVLSVAITKKEGESFSQSDFASTLESAGVPIYTARLQNYEVAGFETRDYLAFVVSDLTGQDNLHIALNLAPSVREFLAKLEG